MFYMEEYNVDESIVLQELGCDSYGDEDFAVFKCPSCKKIYLMDYEVETLYYDPSDLTVCTDCNDLHCLSCGYDFCHEIILGEQASEKFRVTVADFKASKWNRFYKEI